MVLISIDPFAFRRLFLVVLAVAGFSALCLADPVLMAQRYGSEKPRLMTTKAPVVFNVVPAEVSGPLANFQSANLRSPIIPDTVVTLDGGAIPARPFESVASWNSQESGPLKAFYGTAIDSHFPRANRAD